MKKTIQLLALMAMLTAYSNISSGQPIPLSDTTEFCGKTFVAPLGCQAIGNMIKCDNYVFTWTYEPVSDLPRHEKELLAQIKNPKKINVTVNNTDQVGYVSKLDTYDCLLIIGNVNGQGIIINVWLNAEIKTTGDLPECVRQFIAIK